MPGDVIENAVTQCTLTLNASADTSVDGIKKLTEAFNLLGVTEEMIQNRCQCRLDAIRPAQVIHLRKTYTSLKDGMSKINDWFVVPEIKQETSELNNILESSQ